MMEDDECMRFEDFILLWWVWYSEKVIVICEGDNLVGLVGNVGYVCDFDIFWRKMDFELFCLLQ